MIKLDLNEDPKSKEILVWQEAVKDLPEDVSAACEQARAVADSHVKLTDLAVQQAMKALKMAIDTGDSGSLQGALNNVFLAIDANLGARLSLRATMMPILFVSRLDSVADSAPVINRLEELYSIGCEAIEKIGRVTAAE